MAEPVDINKKQFIEPTVGPFSGQYVRGDVPISKLLPLKPKSSEGSANYDLAQQLISMGLGGISSAEFNKRRESDPGFVEQYGLGKAYSYADLAQEALSSDPNFDPNDPTAVTSFAEDIARRGLTNEDREKIQGLAANQSVQQNIERVTNPGKFLNEEQLTANRETAQRLATQYGQEDPDLVDFLADRLGAGESAFELSSFLQTTPQYLKTQSEAENARVQEEAAAARESLNTELLKGQQEAFERATPSIIASYMRAGRLNSSGLNSALTKAQQELERERQGFLAQAAFADAARAQGYRREDFVGGNAAAFNQYLRQNEPAYQQRLAAGQAGSFARFQMPYEQLARQYSLNDQNRARQWELEDYSRQQSDFNRYLDQTRRGNRDAAMWGLAGTVAGSFFGPMGAAAGGYLGNSLGRR